MIFFAKIMKCLLPFIIRLTEAAFPSVYRRKRYVQFFSELFLT